jgi:hypothetical protein
LAPGIEPSAVTDDIARSTRLAPALAAIFKGDGDGILWLYASTESGVHIAYPGHGGYPQGYDPRQRRWYARAKEKRAMDWGPPIIDATTQQLTFTVSAPFYKSEGVIAGVAAIDVLIPNVLLKSLISNQWSKRMKSFLVGQSLPEAKGGRELWLLSQESRTIRPDIKAPPPKEAYTSMSEGRNSQECSPFSKKSSQAALKNPTKEKIPSGPLPPSFPTCTLSSSLPKRWSWNCPKRWVKAFPVTPMVKR